MHNIQLTHVIMLVVITDVIAAIEVNSSADFDVQNFIHSNKPPSVVSSKLPDVFIDAKLNQFGPKGNFVHNILIYSDRGTCRYTCTYQCTYVHIYICSKYVHTYITYVTIFVGGLKVYVS